MSTTYTYWILPEVSVQAMLQQKINELATQYHTPTFEPHMTLLGGFTEDKERALAKAPEIANLLHGLQLSFGPVEYSTTFFQNVFIRIKPSVELMTAYTKAREIVGMNGESLFMPHISLVYGNMPMNERERIAQSVAGVPEFHMTQPFSVVQLVVTPFTPDPSGWEHLQEIQI